ncbi:MAG: diaminopimelate decarboxylase [Gammaproteobacteria bacterium]|nr:MAG: diaminopimelate decarboxylase [Gammaproteobacteria bacterium]
MNAFEYKNNLLHAEDVSLQELADVYGTPCYVYSKAAIEANYRAYENALSPWPSRICYAVKANSNLAVLSLLAKLGAGFDIVSIGELERVIRAGGDVKKVVFSGVAKRSDEIRRALVMGIDCFNIESTAELQRLDAITSEMDIHAHVSLRVNPDVDATTHPYISTGLIENKFGVDINDALEIYQHIATCSHLEAVGVDCHIGSQLLDLSPFQSCFEKIFKLVDQLSDVGIQLKHIDVGGGLGIRYEDSEQPPTMQQYAGVLAPFMEARKKKTEVEIFVEPGRSIVGDAGVLLTRVEHLKNTSDKNFALVDAAMNDLMRPSLYTAWHDIASVEQTDGKTTRYDVVGPVCETGDFLGKDRALDIQEGSLLAVHAVGAYGFVMSSNYNTRLRAAEILVDGDEAYLIRMRETFDQILANEIIPDN